MRCCLLCVHYYSKPSNLSFSACSHDVGYAMMSTVVNKGWHASVCKLEPTEVWEEGLPLYDAVPQLWAFAFCFSKLPELLDTYFIVLRKQNLIFLHWYHHVTVMIYCFYYYGFTVTPTQWFVVMNYFVHSIMYLYYATRASGWVRVPKFVNILITTIQLLQMVAGVWINMYILKNILTVPGFYCDGFVEKESLHLTWAFLMYFSYFVLFAHFFYNVYLKGTKKNFTSVKREKFQKEHTHCSNGILLNNHRLKSGSIDK